MRIVFMCLVAGTLAASVPARSEEPVAAAAITAELAVWIDEQARWQAERNAAARRLTALAEILRDPGSSLNQHGRDVRQHIATVARGVDSRDFALVHARYRADHAEERVAHHDIIDDIDALEQEIRKEQARSTADRVKAVK